MRSGRPAARAHLAEHRPLLDALAFLDQRLRHMRVAGDEAVAVIDLDHDAIAAHGPRVRHAAGRGRVYLGPPRLAEIDARMQREAAEERVGAITEGRSDAGVAKKRHAHRHEGHERLEALGSSEVARNAGQRLVECGRIQIDFGRDRNEIRGIESGLGDDLCVA